MARVKRGVTAHKRHKKVLAQVKGHYSTNNRLYKRAHESLMHALAYAYRDRRNRKRDMRRLWIIRINAASRLNGLPYSKLINGLSLAGHFGDGTLRAHDVASGLLGAVVKDPVQDTLVWREYLETVVKERDGWKDLYRACRELL